MKNFRKETIKKFWTYYNHEAKTTPIELVLFIKNHWKDFQKWTRVINLQIQNKYEQKKNNQRANCSV